MGQSGHAASPHYGDQFQPWVKVESPRLAFSPAPWRARRSTR
jgi:acyl-homoserine lactone acylase PvdQ